MNDAVDAPVFEHTLRVPVPGLDGVPLTKLEFRKPRGGDINPSRYAMDAAAKHLRRTSRFLPSIAEVLAAISDAEAKLTAARDSYERMPALLDHARQKLAERIEFDRKYEAIEQEREAELQASIARREADGKSTEFC